MKPNFNFTIKHSKKDDKNILTIAPSKPVEGFPEKELEVTQEQWDNLQYHFMKGVDDKTGESTLCSI
jgi:hypothetical protein